MRRFSSNPNPLLPLNMSHYSDAALHVDNSSTPKAYSPSNMASVSEDRYDTLIGFDRQERYLQKTLQDLLDAQSEGLQSGLGKTTGEEDVSSAGGDTPKSGSFDGGSKRTKGVVPVRQTTRKKIGLWSARGGISRAINDLATLKSREWQIMEAQLAETEEDLMEVRGLTSKKEGLEQQVLNVENEEAGRNIEQFKQEEKALDVEIKETENKLWEMRARQRQLLGQIEGLDNSVQSKLSSYKAALTLAEKEAKAFLARPQRYSSILQGGSESLWALPVPRRTLEMARDHFYEERERLKQQSTSIEIETTALEEGAVMWEDIVAEVTAVEKTLREEMKRLPTQQSSKTAEKHGAVDGMHNILKRMESAKSYIESQLVIAEERKWNLLMCCVGAELEAIIEGYEILLGVLSASQTSNTAEKDKAVSGRAPGEGQLFDEIEAGSSSTPKPQGTSAGPSRFLDRSEDEDDEPGPELLISHMED